MQERRRCVNPLPVDDTVAKARMFHLAQGVLVGLRRRPPEEVFSELIDVAQRFNLRWPVVVACAPAPIGDHPPCSACNAARTNDVDSDEHRRTMHHQRKPLTSSGQKGTHPPPLHNPVCSARLEPTNGRIRCRRGYGGPRGYAVSSLALRPSRLTSARTTPDDPSNGLRSHKSAWAPRAPSWPANIRTANTGTTTTSNCGAAS